MILVNSGAFLSISSWFCELTELIFVMIPYISSTVYPSPPQNAKDYGYVQVANCDFYLYKICQVRLLWRDVINLLCYCHHKNFAVLLWFVIIAFKRTVYRSIILDIFNII